MLIAKEPGLYRVTWKHCCEESICMAQRLPNGGMGLVPLSWDTPMEPRNAGWREWCEVESLEPLDIPPAQPEPVPEPPNIWDYIAEKTGKERHVCKLVLIGMMYGLVVMPQIVKYGVMHDEVVEMRMAFDDYVHTYREKK